MSLAWRKVIALQTLALSVSIGSASLYQSSFDILPRDITFPVERQDRPPECPPCFNCNLEQFKCMQYGNCSTTSGKCSCPSGFGGLDCSAPLCGSPADKDRLPRPEDQSRCDCPEGWDGVNCNVCTQNSACNALMPEMNGGVCYQGGIVQKENFQMCDVTNQKIKDQLDPRIPQATLSCNAQRKYCNFQFWIDQQESFYCELDGCSWDLVTEPTRNITIYQCRRLSCSCVPDRFLCGENGSIDLTDFLDQSIKGPAKFKTISTDKGSSQDGSTFEEPAMDGLISQFFGDDSILLSCHAGECLYETDVPGYEKPIKKINTPLIAGVIAGCALFVVAAILLVWYLSRRSNTRRYGPLHVSDADNSLLMADHKPTSLHFEEVSYFVNGKQILSGVQGAVHPGQLMAIMGASGAGKTTFLDILARKNKKGISRGDFYVNGQKMSDQDFRSVIGFVDQEDTLLPTLTVHETILDSALLRLPKDMARSAKEQRVEDVEKQLGIWHIRDSIIGAEDIRGISGGEKRRVGIACELVTSPCILFLDEPTSGLDAYNAYNVVECLVNLVKTYNRTVVFTIHQPRSNIVALFDQLVLLANGHTIYSGPFSSCQDYFSSIGYACPPGFNIADYLVDITMTAEDRRSPMDDVIEAEAGNNTRSSSLMAIKSIASKSNIHPGQIQSGSSTTNSPRASTNHIRSVFTRGKHSGVETPTSQVEEEQSLLEARSDPTAPWLRLSRQRGTPLPPSLEDPHQLPPEAAPSGTALDDIIASYSTSDVAAAVADDIKEAIATASSSTPTPTSGNKRTPNGGTHLNGNLHVTGQVKGYSKIGLLGQFRILSARTWRNLYRNPMLMLTHYAIAIVLAVFLGFLFYGVTDDIAGFQNRLGLFFFVLALFGFSTLTSLTVFAQERLLFLRERAKGYYQPISYFAAKVFFDIVPLRLIPPVILGAVVYPMTGLVPAWPQFFNFIFFLILFNFAAAAICLFLGVIFKNAGVANLIGSLTMLFSLLFSGFLLNHETIPKAVLWLQVLSIFHYGFEGLIVNEVRYLSLTDHKYGLDIEVPGATILTTFGFDVKALGRDFVGLAVATAAFLVVGYIAMHFLLVERR